MSAVHCLWIWTRWNLPFQLILGARSLQMSELYMPSAQFKLFSLKFCWSGNEEEGRRGETVRGKEDCGERAGPALLAPCPPTPSSAPPPTHATPWAGAATPPKPRETSARERTLAPDYLRWGVGGSRGPHGSRAERAPI